jgi:hypothetical protein
LDLGVALSDNHEEVVVVRGCLDSLQRPVTTHGEGGHHVRKDDRIPQGQQRIVA